LATILKAYGSRALAENEITKGYTDLTEGKLTRAFRDYWIANDHLPNESPASCFARHYSDPANVSVRTVLQMASERGWVEAAQKCAGRNPTPGVQTLKPRSVSGTAVNPYRPGKALAHLSALAAEQRKANSKLTMEQAFAQGYSDPAYRRLVEQESHERSNIQSRRASRRSNKHIPRGLFTMFSPARTWPAPIYNPQNHRQSQMTHRVVCATAPAIKSSSNRNL
jgi:hypothetical protein